jgi:hypothetical protein
MISKRNLERVHTLLKDYINIDNEIDELKANINSSEHVFYVYKKIKMMAFIRKCLFEKLEDDGRDKVRMEEMLVKF